MKRLLLIILIASLLSGCASFKAWWKEYCHPTPYIESIETNWENTGMDRINYKNGLHEFRKLSQWELDQNISVVDPEPEPNLEPQEEESDDYSLEKNPGII